MKKILLISALTSLLISGCSSRPIIEDNDSNNDVLHNSTVYLVKPLKETPNYANVPEGATVVIFKDKKDKIPDDYLKTGDTFDLRSDFYLIQHYSYLDQGVIVQLPLHIQYVIPMNTNKKYKDVNQPDVMSIDIYVAGGLKDTKKSMNNIFKKAKSFDDRLISFQSQMEINKTDFFNVLIDVYNESNNKNDYETMNKKIIEKINESQLPVRFDSVMIKKIETNKVNNTNGVITYE